MINCEKYKIDTAYSTTVGTTANVALLNNIATGDTANTRTGISVLLKYAYISLRSIEYVRYYCVFTATYVASSGY